MSVPTLDRPPATPPSTSSAARRRRRPLLLLAATALVVVAATVGAGLALANRPGRPAAAIAPEAVAVDQPIDRAAGQGAAADQPSRPDQATAADRTGGRDDGTATRQDTGAGGTAGQAPVLPTNPADAYVRKVDAAGNRIVVDVVQVFHDRAAVEAAIADGKPRSEARYLTTWIRNQNPRLRTLPLAANLRVQLREGCDESGTDRRALLDRLAANAATGSYYYRLTVSGGAVQRIQEHLAINAC